MKKLGDTITKNNNLYLDNDKVGKIIMDGKIPYFQQKQNCALNVEEQEKILGMIKQKFFK